jgi:hypothetical protein
MHSDARKTIITATDLVMLRSILDRPDVCPEGEILSGQPRDDAARHLIALFEQGVTSEQALAAALRDRGVDKGSEDAELGEKSPERHHVTPTPTNVVAGGYRYGKRVEGNGTWTIYHVFSGIPAEYARWKMVGLNVKTAERALRILNAPVSTPVAP